MSNDVDLDKALLALEKEAASSPAWNLSGDDAEMEAEMAREEARMNQLLANPHLALQMAQLDQHEDEMNDISHEAHGNIADSDVLDELSALENQVHAEVGAGHAGGGNSHADEDMMLNDDELLAEAEAEAERIAQSEAKPSAAAKSAAASSTPAVPPPRPARPALPTQQLTSASAALMKPAAPVPETVLESDSLPALQNKLQALKLKAVELNRAGKKAEAMDVMRNYKSVQSRIAELQSKSSSTTAPSKPGGVVPSPKAKPSATGTATAVSPATAAAASVPAATGSKLTVRAQLEYETLIRELDAQIASLTASMKTLVAEGSGAAVKAGSKEAKFLALQYFRAKSRSVKDREILLLAQQRGLKPPSSHHEDLVLQQELSFPELSEDGIEVIVHLGRDLHNSKVVSSPNDMAPLVSVSLEYATDMEGNMKMSAAQSTPALKGANPKWEHSFRLILPITRTNPKDKSALKRLMRSRVVFQILHKRFLLGAVEVARGDVKLKEMSLKAEVVQTLKLKDSAANRCGELDVTIRLRKPFEGIDLRQTKQSLLVVDEFEEAETQQQQPQPTPQPQPVVHAPATVAAKPATTPVTATASVPAVAAAPTKPAAAVSTIDLSNPHLITKMRSNEVLEAEIARMNTEIAQLKSKVHSATLDENGENPIQHQLDELNDRVTAAGIQLDVLVTRVQNGKLTLADYLLQLKEDIVTESKLAIELNKAGNKPDAARVLERVKLMKAEVAGAEENQAELENC